MNQWNRTRRMRTFALLPVVLCLGAAEAGAQESQVDVFGGAGLLAGVDEPRPTANPGANVWIFRRWGASVRHTIATRSDEARQAPPAQPRDARVEILGGAGVVFTDTARLWPHVGANVWMTRHWGVGISHLSWTDNPIGSGVSLFSIRYRLKLYGGRMELHAGASPVALSKYRTGFEIEKVPVFDFSMGGRFHRGFGVRFGLAVGVGDGAFIQPMGLAFWSFD